MGKNRIADFAMFCMVPFPLLDPPSLNKKQEED